MRIGIDCRTILNPERGEKAGIGHYTYYLVKHLLKVDKKNEYVLYFDHTYPEPTEFLNLPNVRIRHFPFGRYKQYLPFGYSHLLITAELKRDRLDVFHATANIIPYGYKRPSVVTVHDLAIYKHPEWFPEGQDFSKKILVPSSMQRARKIIAVSHSTKQDVKKIFGVPDAKVAVVYEGFAKEKRLTKQETQQVTNRYKLAPNYVFSIGVIEPRKNLPGLIKAFDAIVNSNWKKWKDWQLVIAGSKGWKYDATMCAIKDAKCGSCIRYIGYVSHEEKVALMSGAKVFAFPSLWEGFGLPVLEAMGMGVPVISSDVSAIP
ncbi:MAG: glycosyltransferase family 1 protein, partial [Patescibacteria group bacterium]